GAATIQIESERITARELNAQATAVASGLLAAGLQSGERVAVLLPTSVDSLRSWFGIARAGLVEVPLNPAAGSLVLRHCLVAARVRALVCTAQAWRSLAEILADLPPGHQVHPYLVDDPDALAEVEQAGVRDGSGPSPFRLLW